MKGSITKRGENLWLLRVEISRDPVTKKRRQKMLTFYGTRKEAEAELTKMVREVQTGFATEPGKITVAELLDKWLAIAKGKVKITTGQGYLGAVNKWKKTNIAPVPVQKLSPMDIEITIAQMNDVEQSTKAVYCIVLKMA